MKEGDLSKWRMEWMKEEDYIKRTQTLGIEKKPWGNQKSSQMLCHSWSQTYLVCFLILDQNITKVMEMIDPKYNIQTIKSYEHFSFFQAIVLYCRHSVIHCYLPNYLFSCRFFHAFSIPPLTPCPFHFLPTVIFLGTPFIIIISSRLTNVQISPYVPASFIEDYRTTPSTAWSLDVHPDQFASFQCQLGQWSWLFLSETVSRGAEQFRGIGCYDQVICSFDRDLSFVLDVVRNRNC
jgi:hypothetical protein